ncbi:MAG: DUF167 domain-containing protein [Woeseiaceae bacterium]
MQPRAGKNEIAGVESSRLCVRTTAIPADGKANRAVQRIIVDHLAPPASSIQLTRGHKRRNKRYMLRSPVAIPDRLSVAEPTLNSPEPVCQR